MAKKKLYDWGDGRKVHTIPKPKPKTKLYDWGDGKRVHTIDKVTHGQNVEAKGYGIDLNAPVAAPLDARGAYGQAQRAADLEYQPQIQAAQGIQKAAPVWFGDYVGQVAASQKAAQDYAAPLVATAQQGVTNAAATAPGLDPSSPQYAKDQEAAKGRAALAQLGASTLAAIPTATNAYFSGLQTTAARELPQVQAQYGEKVGQLQGQRGAAVQKNYGDIRTGEQNYGIAQQTLGLNTSKAAADVDISRGVDPVTGKPLPSDPETPYSSGPYAGYTPSQVRTKSSTWKDKKKDEYATRSHAGGTGPTAAQKAAAEKAAAKKKKDIQTAVGGAKTTVSDIIDRWDSYKGKQTDDTSKPKLPDGSYPPRNLGPADVKAILGKDYKPGMIHVALLVRAGKPLDKAAIDYLKSTNPNMRIPREWLNGKKRPATKRPGNAPDGAGQQRPT